MVSQLNNNLWNWFGKLFAFSILNFEWSFPLFCSMDNGFRSVVCALMRSRMCAYFSSRIKQKRTNNKLWIQRKLTRFLLQMKRKKTDNANKFKRKKNKMNFSKRKDANKTHTYNNALAQTMDVQRYENGRGSFLVSHVATTFWCQRFFFHFICRFSVFLPSLGFQSLLFPLINTCMANVEICKINGRQIEMAVISSATRQTL